MSTPESQGERDLAAVLSDFARTMATDFPIQGILDELVKRIVGVLPITAAGVTLISPGIAPRYVAASNDAALQFEQLQTELDEGPCIEAYKSGIAIAIPDLRREPRFPRFAPKALAAGLAAVFTFPLNHDDVRLGALDLYRDTAGGMSEAALSAAQTLADVATAYLLNATAREDLQDSANRMREASLHDSLTGLPNRTLMLERLEHAFLRGQRSRKATALFFVDLDRFKEVNDTHGHRVGDELLMSVGERLTGVLRPGDTVARLAGDEFVILCEDIDDPSHVDTIQLRINGVLEPPFALSTGNLAVTASIGVAVTTHGLEPPAQLLHDADVAMYETKRHNFGSRAGQSPSQFGHPRETNDLQAALPGAIERGEMYLDYQPVVDALDGRITGVEALLRWAHPTRGLVSPALVIPLAEQSGQIVEIGEWVLRQAWADRERWEGESVHDLSISINVSGHQLMAAGFADLVATVLLAGSGDPRLLTLDITEAVFVNDSARAAVVHQALRNVGVRLALDDFGTGYSSLTHLIDYPVDTIKMDGALIGLLVPGMAGNTIVSSMINLAHGLGKGVVSEGVETIEQYNELVRLGSDYCQGFYFARPMSAAALDVLMRDGTPPRLPVLQHSSPGFDESYD